MAVAETLGERLREAMKAAGVKNSEVARVAEVHVKTVSQWLNDRFPPSDESLDRIAPLVKRSRSWLRYGSDEGAPAGASPEVSLPQELRLAAKRFELEAMELGADDQAIAFIHHTLTSPEAVALYHGGYREAPSIEAMRQNQESMMRGLRLWLEEYLVRQKEARRR